MKNYFFLFFLVFFVQAVSAQVLPTEPDAQKELAARGISEEDFRARMAQKGYDLDNIQPEQLPELEAVVQQTLDELEQEAKDAETPSPQEEGAEGTSSNKKEKESDVEASGITDTEIKEAVEEGATVEEAVSEKISEQKKEGQEPTKIYGQHIFRDQTLEIYRSADNIKPPNTYVLGPGDEIIVAIFGPSQAEFAFTINEEGFIKPTGGSRLDIGTVRKIKVIRGNESKILDVYDFLFDPTVQYDFFLQNNDIIQVPVSEKIVTIAGAVKRPFKYELLEKEDLVDLIKFAGGLNVNAYLKNVQVNRVVGGQRVIVDVDLEKIVAQNSGFALQNGDIVQVREIGGRLESFTEIEGAVEFPGKYELTPGMRLSDLVARGSLKEEARTDNAFVLGEMPTQPFN